MLLLNFIEFGQGVAGAAVNVRLGGLFRADLAVE
jgi:hypothetical protein